MSVKPKKSLDVAVKKMGFDSYEEYLHSDKWKSLRSHFSDKGCIACGYEFFHLHHVTYERLGHENPTDVVPLCVQCHRKLHKFLKRNRSVPLCRSDIALQMIFGWSDKERGERFAFYKESIESRLKKKDKGKWRGHKRSTSLRNRSGNDYYKIASDLNNFKRLVENGYTIGQLASIYGVSNSYVSNYLFKFRDYFPTYWGNATKEL